MLVIPIHPALARITKRAVKCVEENTKNHELIIVLNGFSERLPLDVKQVRLPGRVSVAKAYNDGFKAASGDIYCCLHNDTEVSEGWAAPLVKEAMRGNIAFPDAWEPNPEARGISPRPEWCPPGCCFMLSEMLFNSLGGFDERFEDFHYEDIDLFLRAHQHGARLKRCDVTVLHHRGASRCFVEDKGDRILARNTRIFYEKHGRVNFPTMEA